MLDAGFVVQTPPENMTKSSSMDIQYMTLPNINCNDMLANNLAN